MSKSKAKILGASIIIIYVIYSIVVSQIVNKKHADNVKVDSSYIQQTSILELSPIPTIDYSPKLEIQDGWTFTTEGDYVYIRGRIKNIGHINIKYWKLTAEFLDKNDNVLDTDYTNSLETIKPNNQKEFEIMHKSQSDYYQARIFIEEMR